MEWKIFDEWLDVRLYQQMKDLIHVVCTKEDKYGRNRENNQYELFSEEPDQTLEEEYQLHYPGEVLERLGERREVIIKQIRALGLALAKTKNLQEESMFIGNQLAAFLKRMHALPVKKDPFLLGIRYLMDEKTKKQSYEALVQYPFEQIAEMLFALSILPEDDRFWNSIKGKLNARLGRDRNWSVYENPGIYVWLAQHFQNRIKGYRKKDIDTLKYLLRLPTVSISSNGEMVKKKLMETGYQKEELAYLNYYLIREVRLPESLDTMSVTAEKLAIEVCLNYLGSEKEYPQQAYELCQHLCSYYRTFKVKVNGKSGIVDVLVENIKVKNVRAFLLLYPYINGRWPVTVWSQFQMLDTKWDALYPSMEKKEYERCVADLLMAEKDTQKLSKSLKHYQQLTGEDYEQRFWRDLHYTGEYIFRHLADYGVLSVQAYMQQFLGEYREDPAKAKEKWQHMMYQIQQYIKGISSYEAFAALKLYVQELGVKKLEKLFSTDDIWDSCFVSEGRCYNAKRLDLFRPFLEVKEHQELFGWIEEYVFQKHTDKYTAFLIQVLSNQENLLWFPKAEAREVFLMLAEKLEETPELKRIRQFYLTAEEQSVLQDREKMLEERRKYKRYLEERKELRCEFTKMIAGSRQKEGQFEAIERFIFRCSYKTTEEAKKSAACYLKALADHTGKILLSKEDSKDLFLLLGKLYKTEELSLENLKYIMDRLEVKE